MFTKSELQKIDNKIDFTFDGLDLIEIVKIIKSKGYKESSREYSDNFNGDLVRAVFKSKKNKIIIEQAYHGGFFTCVRFL